VRSVLRAIARGSLIGLTAIEAGAVCSGCTTPTAETANRDGASEASGADASSRTEASVGPDATGSDAALGDGISEDGVDAISASEAGAYEAQPTGDAAERDGTATDGEGGNGRDARGCSQGPVTPTVLSPSLNAIGPAVSDATTIYFLSRTGSPPNNYAIQSIAKRGGSPTTIFGPTTQIHNLAVDATNVYFTTPGSVLRCALSGCGNAPSTVATLQVNPEEIVTNGTSVFYTLSSSTSIMTCPVAGCGSGPTVFADTGDLPVDIATDGVKLYWTSLPNEGGVGAGAVSSCPLRGCSGGPTVLASGQENPAGISTDGVHVFWSDIENPATVPGTIEECNVNGCGSQPTTVGRAWDNSPTYAAGEQVYWGDYGSVLQCEANGCSSMPTQVFSNATFGQLVASDSSGLYFLTDVGSGGPLVMCPPCGCTGDPAAAGPLNSTNNAQTVGGVATDGTTIFWVDEDPNGTGEIDLYSCTAANCANTTAVEYTATNINSPFVSGQYLYFFVADSSANASTYAALIRCPTAKCSAGAAALYPHGSYEVGGTLSGLIGSVTLEDNAGNTLTVTANGAFAFSSALVSGASYGVTVSTQPSGETCTVSGGSGIVGNGNVTSIAVNCTASGQAPLLTIGGTVSGWLPGPGTLTLQDAVAGTVSVNSTGSFAFPNPVAAGTSYNVRIQSQPVRVPCTISNGTGSSFNSDITSIAVECGDSQPSGLTGDGQFLYWASADGGLRKMPIAGGSIQSLTSGIDTSGATVAVDGSNVYFTLSNGTVNEAPLTGGGVTLLATGQTNPSSLVLAGSTLYWIASNEVMSLPLGSAGGPITIGQTGAGTSFGSTPRIAVDNGAVYWVSTNDGVTGYDDSVQRALLPGGRPTPIVSGQLSLSGGLVATGGRVFFAAALPALMSVSE
jgi:hypothetical protein